MIIYIEIYNVDKEKKCYVIFEQADDYKINLDTNLLDNFKNVYIARECAKKSYIDEIKDNLMINLNIEILDNELTDLGYDNDGTHFLCLQTFLRKKHIIKLKKFIKNINDEKIKITYFRNKKKINKLFLYDIKLYSLYRKFIIHESIKYDMKELCLI
jgi:hypothetical protein